MKEVTVFGFLLGTACLVGLIWVLGHRHHCSARGRHLGRRLFEELDMTPGQEKLVRTLLEDFSDSVRERARALRRSAEDVGRAVRGEKLDEALLAEVFAQHDRLLGELRPQVVELLRRIHETLDDRQRRRLGRLIESAPGWASAWSYHAHCAGPGRPGFAGC